MRRGPYGLEELGRLIAPRSIAVVGASATEGSFGNLTLKNLARFQGRVFGVNPKLPDLGGVPCFASLAELPEAPDCVISSVPAALVEGVLRDAAAKGAGGVILYASGFAETAREDMRQAQTRIRDFAAATGVRVVGPNCIGLINFRLGAGMTFTPGFDETPIVAGDVAVISQSGNLGYTLIQAMQRGFGFSHYLATGNSADVDVADFVNAAAEDPDVAAIACVYEGLADGRKLVEAGRRALALGKPVVVCKIGATERSREVALSHTGSLVGSHDAFRAACDKAGIVAVDDMEALLETTRFLSRAGAPKAAGISMISTSGGAAIICADMAERAGMDMPQPRPETKATLARYVPDFGSTANPADLTAEALRIAGAFEACAGAMLADPQYAALLFQVGLSVERISRERAPALTRLAKQHGKPVCVVWMSEWLEAPGVRPYEAADGVTVFRSFRRCMATLAAWMRRDAVARRAPHRRLSDPAAGAAARELLAEEMTERTAKAILAAYGVKTTREALATTADEAVREAARLGYPVALKLESPEVAHKTEAGVVRLGLGDDAAVRTAFAEIVGKAAGVRANGVLVQEMVPPGVEIVVGARRDPQFGPLVMVGLGGVLVELLGDVAFALAPVGPAEAREMLDRLKGRRLLDGWRGAPAADVEALVDAIVRVSELAADLEDDVVELDVNPVISGPDRAVAVDALIVKG